MVLGKRKGPPRKSAFELLAKKRRGKGNKGQENYKTTSHCEPKAKQSHLPKGLLAPEKILWLNRFPIVKETSNIFQFATSAEGSLKIVTSQKFPVIVWKMRNRINKFVDSKG